jgi:hypothetical protein
MPTLSVTNKFKKSTVNTSYRSRIAAQNLLEGDEFVMRGEPNIFVTKITRNETKGTITVTFTNGMKRKYTWNRKAVIMETPDRHLFRRNSLRRQGYPNYFVVAESAGTSAWF